MGGILGKSIAHKRLASPWDLGTPPNWWLGDLGRSDSSRVEAGLVWLSGRASAQSVTIK